MSVIFDNFKGSLQKQINDIEIQHPKHSSVPTIITLKTLVENGYLNIGAPISFTIKGTKHKGHIRELSNGQIVLYSQQKGTYSPTPHGFIKKVIINVMLFLIPQDCW